MEEVIMKTLKTRSHLLSGASLTNLVVILYKNRSEITFKRLPDLFLILLTPLIFFPLYLAEVIFYSRKINQTRITKDPVFIIGHWRSGTTYMHNLLCLDKQFGFPTTYQCFVPGMFLSGKKIIKAIHKTTLPEKRPMDDVKVDSDFPQEEEFMISGLSPFSYYQSYFFPGKIADFFSSYALVSSDILVRWEKLYLFLVKKITFVSRGKQLVLKNPVNTVRIKHLVRMFPDAKFIYLHRNPEEVLKSTCKLFDRFLELYSLRSIHQTQLKNDISWVYSQTLKCYADQKHLIGKTHLAEVNYADFIRDPYLEMERVYNELGFEGFDAVSEVFREYIRGQARYQPEQW
jgi:omega-hydroxy-beta-dihydromenaquinone-9 sulfotransferase